MEFRTVEFVQWLVNIVLNAYNPNRSNHKKNIITKKALLLMITSESALYHFQRFIATHNKPQTITGISAHLCIPPRDVAFIHPPTKNGRMWMEQKVGGEAKANNVIRKRTRTWHTRFNRQPLLKTERMRVGLTHF